MTEFKYEFNHKADQITPIQIKINVIKKILCVISKKKNFNWEQRIKTSSIFTNSKCRSIFKSV